MIKIQSSGASATMKFGLSPWGVKMNRGRLGEAAKECAFNLGTAVLHAMWKDKSIEAVLSADADTDIHTITLELKYHLPRAASKTALWTEGPYEDNPTPRLLPSFRRNHGNAWGMWIAENPEAAGLFFHQSPPIRQPIGFRCHPASRSLAITWTVNQTVKADEDLRLPDVLISRGKRARLVDPWRHEWKSPVERGKLTDGHSGWQTGKEVVSLKNLREALSAVRTNRIKLNWFALGPQYASATGDWLTPHESFKDRMGSASRTIAEANIVPGLRFAPFLVSRKSAMAEEKRDWLISNAKGSPLQVRGYTADRDVCHVLDVTRPEVVKHILQTFTVMRDRWGFRMFRLERVGDLLLPGRRFNDDATPGAILESVGSAIRAEVGPSVFLSASGFPHLAASGFWDAQDPAPSFGLMPKQRLGSDGQALMKVVSALLRQAPWNEVAWVNSSGELPMTLFRPDAGVAAETLRTTAALSTGMAVFSGDPRGLDSATVEAIHQFQALFAECRGGRLFRFDLNGGLRDKPVLVRNNRGWMLVINPTDRKKEIHLNRESLKEILGVTASLSAGVGAVFNSPEIHVALSPWGHRLFRG